MGCVRRGRDRTMTRSCSAVLMLSNIQLLAIRGDSVVPLVGGVAISTIDDSVLRRTTAYITRVMTASLLKWYCRRIMSLSAVASACVKAVYRPGHPLALLVKIMKQIIPFSSKNLVRHFSKSANAVLHRRGYWAMFSGTGMANAERVMQHNWDCSTMRASVAP